MPNEIAPEGTMWVCKACGKPSRDRYGDEPYDRGWDESCTLNAVLCKYSAVVLPYYTPVGGGW